MKQRFDLSLYLVTDPEMTARRGLVETVAAAVEGGVTMVQLRHKDAPARAMVEAGRALHALLAPRGIPLIVNDRVDVAYAVGAEGVHVGQDDLPPATARAIAAGANGIAVVSAICAAADPRAAAQALRAAVDAAQEKSG
jgi:thiamine-phosphate pyrophosphorylase